MHNFPNGMDVQQTKKNIRQLLFEQALVKKPKPIWPGFDCSSYSTDSDLYTAWIESWYSPLSMLLSANQLQVTLPNPFFSTPFHAHAKAFFQDAVSKVNLELFINKSSDSPHSAKYHKPADLDQEVVTSCLDAFLLNTKNEYSLKTLRKFCTSELNVSQIILRGPTGSGKTFLLNAVIDDFRIGSNVSSRYLNCSQFQDICRNDCQYSSEKINPSAFQCLAVDDIHLLAQDQAAQIKLAQIMDNLALHGQRLVLSALWDSAVEDPLAKLLPELKSRLSLGLVLFLQEPDLDIRLRYVKQLFSRKNMPLPQDFLLYLARRCQDLRQLQGITEQIALFWAHTGQLPDEHYLGNMLRSSGGGDSLNPDAVMAIVAAKYGCQARDLRGDKRTPNLVQARQIAMFLCRELLGESYPNLGKAFGGKDHSTVMYAVKKIKKMQITNKEMNNLLAQLTLECSKYGG